MSDPVIKLENITKTFPGVIANDAISLEIRKGEVLCLLGENGAGKSTLISVLAGFYKPDSGTIFVDCKATHLSSPSVSIANGIGVVYQHSALIQNLTVLDNLMLGGGNKGGGFLKRAPAKAKLLELSALLGTKINPDLLAADLSLGQQQQVEIVKALWNRPRVLVFDEPTSMLTPEGAKSLIATVRRLKDEGIAIVFITHKLLEALEAGDRVTVLKSGRVAANFSAAELTGMGSEVARERILEAMFGTALKKPGGESTDKSSVGSSVILRLENITTDTRSGETPIVNVFAEIKEGEILGVAGIDGHGQKHLAEVIAGQRQTSSGQLFLRTKDITKLSVKDRQRLGVRYVTDDRIHEGIIPSFSVALNLILKKIGERPFWKWGKLNRAAMLTEAETQIRELEIKTPSPLAQAGNLSGGNIQKLLLARELSHAPKVVVFNKPSYGLDLKTVFKVREAVRDFARSGGAALLISTDLDELSELAHRIVVISNGRLIGEVNCDSLPTDDIVERVGKLMAGA